ncbi:hypothetical protein BT96DRAFT_988820 [Gymnopus androsaceus JB14]|uniref:Uncharacterized protein n=1 Tax=Gymnopus androsaceus JB14 TaxID=1447944 RepID=A0A6A4I7E2_9AGAR|nr:hypothetical protein BT96DRAFT_988820 [Gymnopus androsaceus JB14]
MADVGMLNLPNIASHNPTPSMKVFTSVTGGFPIAHGDALAWANRVRAANNERCSLMRREIQDSSWVLERCG